jgi:hypothetical protein
MAGVRSAVTASESAAALSARESSNAAASATAVPEPTALALMITALAFFNRRPRRP